MRLRQYQEDAVAAVYRHLRDRNDNPCVVIPTAGGKTPILATICRDVVERWHGRVLVLSHVKELLQQAVEKLGLVAPDLASRVGVYSAGLKRRDTTHPILVAGIQSVYKRACELDAFDIVIVDESHLIPPDGEGRYQTFFKDAYQINPNLRVIGLTATPFRMKSGRICAPDHILNHVCFEIGVRELIRDGYLSPLITKLGRAEVDTSKIHIQGGEFVSGEAEDLMDTDELVTAACEEIVELTRDRRSVLIFATGRKHGRHIASVLQARFDADVATVFGDTLPFEREQVLSDFKAGTLKFLVNVNVLTTGFDAPNIDCVALVRPTLSPGLFYQMVGRGFRIHPAKENCLVLDFGGNVARHGPVDRIKVPRSSKEQGEGSAPIKSCPLCRTVVAAGTGLCPECGYEFPSPNRQRHERRASTEGILSGAVTDTEYKVLGVTYRVHTKRGALPGAPKTLRVEYQIGFNEFQSEWICIEHTGWARQKAEQWWRTRSNAPVPDTAEEAVYRAEDGCLAPTHAIVVRHITGDKFDKILRYQLGEKPAYREPGWDEESIDDEVEDDTYASMTLEEVPF